MSYIVILTKTYFFLSIISCIKFKNDILLMVTLIFYIC